MNVNLVLGTAIGAVVAASVAGLFAFLSQLASRRQERVTLAVEMAKLQQDYQRMMVEMAKKKGLQFNMPLHNPTFEIPRYLRIVDGLNSRDYDKVRAEFEASAAGSEFEHLT